MRHNLKFYNSFREENGEHQIKIGIGIYTGSIMQGVIGEAERIDRTIISDAVNISAQIDERTKT